MKICGFLFFICFFSIACSSLPVHDRRLTLDEVESLEIGKVTKSEAVKKLGPAYREIKNASKTVLVFLDPTSGNHRASMTFDSRETLVGKLWQVNSGENEEQLDAVKARYSTAVFEMRDAEWTSHYEPSERYYIDRNVGIRITVDKFNKLVDSIGWSAPGDNGQVKALSSQIQ